MLCVGPAFMPIAAIVDYELTYSVPRRTTADTAIDSLTHAIEAFVSKKSNLFSDTQAISAMELIAPNIRKAYNNGKDKLFGFFVGQVMKATQGKANPKSVNLILKKALSNKHT